MPGSLFEVRGTAETPYWHLKRREAEIGCDARARLDAMWTRFRPYADAHFAREFPNRTYHRYWEMYLGCCLIDRGFEVHAPKPVGPDFIVGVGKLRILIEAVAPTQGAADSPDRVPDVDYNLCVGADYPEDKHILRYRTSIEEKRARHECWVAAGVVDAGDPYVIAVSAIHFPVVFDDVSAPGILKAVLPIGFEQICVEIDTGNTIGCDYSLGDAVAKASGSTVAANPFLDSSYSAISAIMFSIADILNTPQSPGSEFVLVHNPLAANPLPLGTFPFGREYMPMLDGSGLSVPHLDHEAQ